MQRGDREARTALFLFGGYEPHHVKGHVEKIQEAQGKNSEEGRRSRNVSSA